MLPSPTKMEKEKKREGPKYKTANTPAGGEENDTISSMIATWVMITIKTTLVSNWNPSAKKYSVSTRIPISGDSHDSADNVPYPDPVDGTSA